MMKKMTSMFLALVMCLALSVPAFAAEEEPELTDEPAVQTEVETEATTEPIDELVAQGGGCLHDGDYSVRFRDQVDPTNYTDLMHAVDTWEIHTCLACGKVLKSDVISTSFVAHRIQVTEYGTALGSNGETVTVYLYQCRACNYSYVEP